MADTTTNRGWTIPVRGSDPWYSAFLSLMNEIDTDVAAAISGGGGTLDDAYDADTGERTVAVDDGSVSWDLSGARDFIVDIASCSETYGFKVEDGADYFRLTKQPTASISLSAELAAFSINCSDTTTLASAGLLSINANSLNLRFAGLGSAYTPFNETGDLILSGFTATSLVGALNELKAASGTPTLNECYEAGAPAERTITMDLGTVSWDILGDYDFFIDLASASDNRGFKVEDGADYFRVTKQPSGSLRFMAEVAQCNIQCSDAATLQSAASVNLTAGSTFELNFAARGAAALPFNETGDLVLSGFIARSLIGAMNELKAASITPTLNECYEAGAPAERLITMDLGPIKWDTQGTHDFIVDVADCNDTYGFKVADGADYFHVVRKSSGSLLMDAELYELNINCSGSADITSGTMSLTSSGSVGVNITASGSGADITLEADDEVYVTNGTEFLGMKHDATDMQFRVNKGSWKVLHNSPVNLADDGSFDLPSRTTGYGWVLVHDAAEYAYFTWTSAGVVTLIQNSANVVNADTDANFCIFDNGSEVRIRNRLGGARLVLFSCHYHRTFI
jgi:hypothetical protein